MQLGQLNRLITIERIAVGVDDRVGSPETWQPFTTAWASVKTRPAKENEVARHQRAVGEVTFLMHWSPALDEVTPQMRLVDDRGRRHGITSVENVDHQNRWIRITCRTVT